ncbi:MAG TPA: hypothetical protein PKH07_01950, partial [bacterium]|nr:hypothetical protein [bacterium]
MSTQSHEINPGIKMRFALTLLIACFLVAECVVSTAQALEDSTSALSIQERPMLLAQSSRDRSSDDDLFGDNRRSSTSYRSERQRSESTTTRNTGTTENSRSTDTSRRTSSTDQDRRRIEEERARRSSERDSEERTSTPSQPTSGDSGRSSDRRGDGRSRRESGSGQPGSGGLEIVGPSPDAPAPPSPPGARTATGQVQAAPSERAILYLSPSSNIVSVGQRFVLNLNLENPKELRFDKLGVTLSYDPRFLAVVEPAGEEASAAVKSASNVLIQPNAEYRLMVNRSLPDKGLAFYHVHMMDGDTRRFKGSFGQIQFEAVEPSSATTIRFVGRDANVSLAELDPLGLPWTYLEAKGEDILGQPKIEGDGVLSATVRVNPSGEPLSPYATLRNARKQQRDRIPQGSVALSIVPSMLSVRQGEPFSVR